MSRYAVLKGELNFKMTTLFGKKHGWELQKLLLSDRKTFWRVTTPSSCWPATEPEIQLWKMLGRAKRWPKQGYVNT